MTTQNYLIIENNAVTNIVVWDGNTQTWAPPVGSTQLVKDTTPAMVWILNQDKTEWVLSEIVGIADIGFTWNGTVCTTNQSKPATPVVEPVVETTPVQP